jgi:enamine deaminase RidA (YjgF/YER057c/UK114 family)
MAHDLVNPRSWKRPRGYSNGVLAEPGRWLFVAGQIGWDEREKLVSDELPEQFQQALKNVISVVREAGGQPEHLCRLTIYVTNKKSYGKHVKEIGRAYRAELGRHYPAMALVEVADLLEPGAKVEIAADAVIPNGRRR